MEQHVISYIHQVWGSKDRFPGPQPISIERKHFPILRNNVYVVCEKTDGERYMLVATRWQGRNVSVFVNRSFRMFESRVNLPKNAYDGTILDGELCDGGVYMAYDAIVVCGEPVGHMHFIDRYAVMEKCIKRIITMKSDPYRVRLKIFHTLDDFERFERDHLPTVQQRIDGLVFTPVYEPVKMGTHETMFKWKPRDQNTIDFQMKRDPYRPGVWRLYVQEKGQLVFETSFENYEEPWFGEDAIVECQYMIDDAPMWWRPLKLRTDKTHPNNRRTFYRTLVNIKEDIQMSEFNNIV
jgi:hypothetical protein